VNPKHVDCIYTYVNITRYWPIFMQSSIYLQLRRQRQGRGKGSTVHTSLHVFRNRNFFPIPAPFSSLCHSDL